MNEVVNGIAERGDVELAVIPRGTGWDFVRTFGIPRDLDARVDVALHGDAARDRPRARHVPHVGGRRGARAVRERRERRHERRDRAARERDVEGARRQGLVLLGDARRLLRLADGEMRVTVDGEARSGRMNDAMIATAATSAAG